MQTRINSDQTNASSRYQEVMCYILLDMIKIYDVDIRAVNESHDIILRKKVMKWSYEVVWWEGALSVSAERFHSNFL